MKVKVIPSTAIVEEADVEHNWYLKTSQTTDFYMVSSSLILVWPLWVWIPESLPTKLTVLFCVFFDCKCVLYHCHRVLTQLQLTNISISISNYQYHTCYVSFASTIQGQSEFIWFMYEIFPHDPVFYLKWILR